MNIDIALVWNDSDKTSITHIWGFHDDLSQFSPSKGLTWQHDIRTASRALRTATFR
jgi:hypothetical protein